MRWTTKIPEDGERRIIKRFLWLPLQLPKSGNLETRWLESANILQQYHSAANLDGEAYWINISFVAPR